MSPTRVPVFDRVHRVLGDDVKVFYPARLEGDRDNRWAIPVSHPHRLLKPRSFAYSFLSMKRYVHVNPDIWRELGAYDPNCVIIFGLHPTALLAWLWSILHHRKFIAATDACLKSDSKNSFLHFMVRRLVFRTADAAIGTSRGSRDLFNRYGSFDGRYFNCWLCADNDRYGQFRGVTRQHDLLFAGQFIPRKLPFFFVDVVEKIRRSRPGVSVLLVGDGPLHTEVVQRLAKLGVKTEVAGFVSNEELPARYASARLFLFPTQLDAYGVVANEALACGTPVICNEEPGAAGEVVVSGQTGYVLPLDPELWARHAVELLEHPAKLEQFAVAGYRHVQKYNFTTAAAGLLDAYYCVTAETP